MSVNKQRWWKEAIVYQVLFDRIRRLLEAKRTDLCARCTLLRFWILEQAISLDGAISLESHRSWTI